MTRIFSPVLILSFLISCNKKEQQEGIQLPHSTYRTTVMVYDDFYLHTFTNDTLYRNCGYVITVEPKDSTINFDYFSTNSKLVRRRDSNLSIVLEATADPVEFYVISNKIDTTRILFKSPELPTPVLSKSFENDSVTLTLSFNNPRLKDILPNDTRFKFLITNQVFDTLRIDSIQLDTIQIQTVRANYMKKFYEIKLE
ncbi:hypothetical protein [Ekhidna sp.]|uniref:hypothetical protein n=1 Tax=Ekhidna sp. TaxID=2608089 RepID=UPI003CCC2641